MLQQLLRGCISMAVAKFPCCSHVSANTHILGVCMHPVHPGIRKLGRNVTAAAGGHSPSSCDNDGVNIKTQQPKGHDQGGTVETPSPLNSSRRRRRPTQKQQEGVLSTQVIEAGHLNTQQQPHQQQKQQQTLQQAQQLASTSQRQVVQEAQLQAIQPTRQEMLQQLQGMLQRAEQQQAVLDQLLTSTGSLRVFQRSQLQPSDKPQPASPHVHEGSNLESGASKNRTSDLQQGRNASTAASVNQITCKDVGSYSEMQDHESWSSSSNSNSRTCDPGEQEEAQDGDGLEGSQGEFDFVPRNSDEVIAAISRITRFLDFRERCSSEVLNKLQSLGYSRELSRQVLKALQDSGVQSDARFAESYVRSQWRSKGQSPSRLAYELRCRSVAGEYIEAALQAVFGDTKQLARSEPGNDAEEETWEHLVELCRRRVAYTQGEPAQKRRAKLAGWLQRRGHSMSTIYKVFNAVGI